VGLPNGEKILRICITVYTQYRRVTDGQTSCHGIVRAMHTRRAVTKLCTVIDRLCSVISCKFCLKQSRYSQTAYCILTKIITH